MKPDYKNWVPRGLLFLLGGMAIICLALCIVFGMAGVATEGGLRIALGVLFGAAFLLFAVLTGIFANMYCAFSYHGKKQVSKRVIEGIAQYVALSDGGKGLDVGRRKGVGCRMRQRGAYHRLCKAQSARADGRHRPLGQRIRLVQSSALRTQCRGGRGAKRIIFARERRKTRLSGQNVRRRDEQLCLSQHQGQG